MLPAGKLVSKYFSTFPNSCPLCYSQDEDHQHILRCPHPSRVLWPTSLIEHLTSRTSTLDTDPILTKILLQGLQQWLSTQPLEVSQFPLQYQLLLSEQSEIGWYQLFLGRFSLQWSILQQAHLSSRRPIVKGRSGNHWTQSIATSILKDWLTLWTQRNQDRHGIDTAHRTHLLKEQTLRELDVLYNMKPLVLHRDRDLFFQNYTQHKEKPTHLIRQWINTYRPVLLKSAKDAKLHSIFNVRNLVSYFGRKK